MVTTLRSATLDRMFDEDSGDFARAFDVAPTSLSISDVHGRVIAANAAFWSLFGWEPGTELDVGMLSRPEDQDWTRSYLTRLVTGGEDEFRSVKRFVRRDGTEFHGRLTVHPLRADGRCVALVGHIEPTDRRPAVQDAGIRKILQHDAGTITVIDGDGTVLETAGRYRTTLGYPPEFWEDRSILDLLVADDVDRVVALREELLAQPGRIVTGDFRVMAADRRIEVLEATAVNLLDDPDVGGIVLSTRNVTEERANAETLAQLRDDAVAEAERRSQLLAVVSHELRNPLHAMTGLAELLSSDDALAGHHRELTASLHRQLIDLAAVTDDLLAASRLEMGHFELRKASVLVRDLVDDLVATARSSIDGHLELTAVVDPRVPAMIVTDPARLRQILSNLVNNAVKFTEAGRVDVTVDRREAGELVFEIADTGPGIPADELDRVFEPFTTASTSRDRRGAGLGLAIVRRLAEALGGSVVARSKVGVGSTFTFALPCEGATQPGRPAGADPATGGVDSRRVLVVEDTPVNQELARHQLTRLGMDAHVVSAAEEALDLLDREGFDVVLMDHQLPGMNGREATRAIRASGSTIPIIGITASSTAADEQACLDAGMDAFLAKPAGLADLRGALAAVLGAAPDWSSEAQAVEVPAALAERDAIDESVLDDLSAELGDREIVMSLVETFLDALGERRADISGADAAVAARQAHTLKSSARLLGANALADACEAAEADPTARAEIGTIADAAEAGLRGWLASVRAGAGT